MENASQQEGAKRQKKKIEKGGNTVEEVEIERTRHSMKLEASREAFLQIQIDKILDFFREINKWTMFLLGSAWAMDIGMISAKLIEPKDRLITSMVIISLVAGTVTQLGALAIGIGRTLLPASEKNGRRSRVAIRTSSRNKGAAAP